MAVSSTLAIVFTLVFSIALPIGLMLLFRRKGGKWTTFLVGAATFVLFAMFLEPILHNLVSRSPLWAVLQGNIWLYGLYGGLAAGVFEETGRFLAFKLVLKKEREPITALSYGAGHGGIEAILLVGLTMVSNLMLAALVSSGGTTDPVVLEAAAQLAATPAEMFLWAAVERLGAVVLHLSLSILVFASVRTPGKKWLFPAAILTHAAANFVAGVSTAYLPAAVTELIVLAVAAAAALFARTVYRTLPAAEQET